MIQLNNDIRFNEINIGALLTILVTATVFLITIYMNAI